MNPRVYDARRRSAITGAAGLAALALAAVSFVPAASAADDTSGVDVVNTETVQVYVGSDGEVDSKRVYEQLSLTGKGTANFANPVSEEGLRNLDGFSGFDTDEGSQTVEADVDGVERYRTVSDYAGELPLEVSIDYFLDGDPVEPDDLVGAEGALEVRYTVRNVTSEPREVTFDDGKGGTLTKSVAVPIPMVGSLTTTAPASFTEVRSQQANTAGDGKGGTKLSFTMTLFPPLGSDTATFGYTANITDGVVPSSSISALPVNPLESPTFKTAGSSYKAGAETGAQLAAGATEIDTNLLRLRDGAAKLLNGLVQLSDGADQLNAGLAGEAAPGAERLASGALQLDDGLGELRDGTGKLVDGTSRLNLGAAQLDDGAGRLADGATQLSDGATRLADGAGSLADGTGAALTGSQQLEGGLKQISDGLGQLAGTEGLPKALKGAEQLKAGVDEILFQVGDVNTDNTLLGGLHDLETGLIKARDGSARIAGGLSALRGDGSEATPGLVAAKGGVDQVQSGLADAVAGGGSLDQLIMGLQAVTGTDCGPICQTIINDQILPKVRVSKENLSAANQGLQQVSGGLGTAIGALDTQLIPGAQALNVGLVEAAAGSAKLKEGGISLRGGLMLVQGGLGELQIGLTKAVAGVVDLDAGAVTAHEGSGDLADGLTKIDDGAGQLSAGGAELADGAGRLSDGAGQLADGAGRLSAGTDELASGATRLDDGAGRAADGAGQLAGGADKLADGLGAAADGSGRLADGLHTAADGAPALVDGAGRLSDEGMSKLIAAGEDTAQNYGELYATIEAAAERADAERMAIGAPEGATGLTAYSYELMGNDGEGGRNLTRGLGAALLLGLGLGATVLRRRFI